MKRRTSIVICLIICCRAVWAGHGSGHSQKEIEYHERMLSLERQVDGLLVRSVSMAKQAFGIDATSIRAPFGRALLLRRGSEVAVVTITKRTRPKAAAVRWQGPTYTGALYSAVVGRLDADGRFIAISKTESEVFQDATDPSRAVIVAGAMRLQWSVGDWVELANTGIEAAVTEFVAGDEIRVNDPMLQWMTPTRLKRILAGKES